MGRVRGYAERACPRKGFPPTGRAREGHTWPEGETTLLARTTETSKRWLLLALSVTALATALVMLNVLGSRTGRAASAEAAARLTPERASAAVPAVSRATSAQGREDASPSELRTRVTSATEALVQALESPDYETERWQIAVADRARALGQDALPALRALLADEERSVEEHVAATELVAALEQR